MYLGVFRVQTAPLQSESVLVEWPIEGARCLVILLYKVT